MKRHGKNTDNFWLQEMSNLVIFSNKTVKIVIHITPEYSAFQLHPNRI